MLLLQFYLPLVTFFAVTKEISSDVTPKLTGFSSEELSSLVFVFDVTGSMSEELDQVKKGASKILDTFAEHKERVIGKYVFVPFNDPEVGPHIATTNMTEFRTMIQNLKVDGGGDCPEMSLRGIKEGLEISSPKSYILVFTDANPKDKYLLPDVITLIREKQSQIIFLLTGTCEDTYAPEYQQIASISTGQIFNLLKADVHHVLDFVRSSVNSHGVNLFAVDSPKGTGNSPKTFPIPIDETLTKLMVSISGKNTAIRITDSFGKRIDETSKARTLLNLNSVKIISIMNPHPGIWGISVRSTFSYSIRVTGTSYVSFVYGFSIEYTPYLNDTNRQPFKGVKNYILVMPNDLSQIVNLTTCDLISLNGSVINTVPLLLTTTTAGVYYGSFVPNDTNFHLQVNGISVNGTFFRRITPSAVHTDPSALIISVPGNQTLLLNTNYSLNCKVESAQPFQMHWLKDGVLLKDLPSTRFNQSGEITIQFPRLSLANAGNYTCAVIREGVTKSKSTKIRVVDPPSIHQTLPSRIQLKWNDDYAIPCSAKGYPEPKISWILNYSTAIQGAQYNGNLVVLPDNTFLLLNALTNQSGFYSCIAKNEAGEDFRHYEITVRADDAYHLDANTTLVKSEIGEGALFYCPANGSNSIQWLKNGLPLDMKSNDRSDEPRLILAKNGKKLKIIDVDTADLGNYTCISTNTNESSVHNFYLQVLVPLSFIDAVEPVFTVQNNKNVTLDCRTNGSPAPTVTWRKKDFTWPVNGWTLPNVTLNNPSKQILTVHSFKRDLHSGTYECEVKNEVSSIRRKFSLA